MASLPQETIPVMDGHLVHAIALIGLAAVHAGDTLGLGTRRGRSPRVARFPFPR